MRYPIPFLWIKEMYCGSFYLERNEREKVKGLELLQLQCDMRPDNGS